MDKSKFSLFLDTFTVLCVSAAMVVAWVLMMGWLMSIWPPLGLIGALLSLAAAAYGFAYSDD